MKVAVSAVTLLALAACAGEGGLRHIISTDFEGGSLGRIMRLGESTFVCAVEGQADQDGRNRQASWYSFRLSGMKGRNVTITLTDLVGEYNYKPGAVAITDDTLPHYSTDLVRWKPIEDVSFDEEKKELTFRFKPTSNRLWIAHAEPYTTARFARFLGKRAGRPDLRIQRVGTTVEERDILLLTITNPKISDQVKKCVWLMIRQHAWESGSSFAGEGAIQWMLSDDPEAIAMRDEVVFKVFPMMDPDGCAGGGVRFNRKGYDLNRNWDVTDRERMPEIAAAQRALNKWLQSNRKVDIFVTVHNEERGEWMSGSELHADLADRFFRMLRETTTFGPGKDGPSPAPKLDFKHGRAQVHAWLQKRWKLPAFLIEQRIAFNERLGRIPTSVDRLEFGRGLARAMCRVVTEKKKPEEKK